MNKTIQSISFLFGLFCTISLYLLYKLIPHSYYINNEIKEKFTTTTNSEQNLNTKKEELNIVEKLPKYDDNFMLLTTFNNNNKISNNETRWYDNDVDISKVLMTDYNKGLYFTLNNTINFVDDKIVTAVKGANIKNVEMTGPVALYFSNSNIAPFILSEFSLLFMIKFKEIIGMSTLFEMLCNTTVIDTKDNKNTPTYVPNIVSIDIIESIYNTKQIKINITFGSKKYTISDLDKSIILNDDINLIGLTLNQNTNILEFIINNKSYKFNNDNKEKITLGSQPIIINKFGELNASLYSMAYYKKALNQDDITQFVKYNQYYFTGMDKIMLERIQYQKLLENAKLNANKNQDKLENMTKLLDKCIYKEKTIKEEPKPIKNIPKIELNILKAFLPSKI